MAFAIATAPLALALAWLQARYPQYGALISRGEVTKLERLVRRATLRAVIVGALGGVGATAAVWLIGKFSPTLAARSLPPVWIGVLAATNVAWIVIQSAGSYLRAWRQEPLTETALLGGSLVIAGTLAASVRMSTEGTITTYSILVAGLLTPLVLLKSFRRLRHFLRTNSGIRAAAN
jgi:hypothetical protein